jgi:hypothetical protein
MSTSGCIERVDLEIYIYFGGIGTDELNASFASWEKRFQKCITMNGEYGTKPILKLTSVLSHLCYMT